MLSYSECYRPSDIYMVIETVASGVFSNCFGIVLSNITEEGCLFRLLVPSAFGRNTNSSVT
jgi:hypothetical protein